MTWGSFVEYVTMVELGQSDSVYRNYDLDNLNGSKPGVLLDRAFARMGFDQPNTARPFVLPAIAQRLRNMGYTPPADMDALAALARQWYHWDRIRRGELHRFPMRPPAFDLLA